MITLEQYFGVYGDSPDLTPERRENANLLLSCVNQLMVQAEADGILFPVNPKTGSQISGETLGGFRPQNAPVGAPKSNHKNGLAVDIYDPSGKIDAWCIACIPVLRDAGIYIEHPDKTPGWSHWQCVAPRSGIRVFMP